MFNLYIPKSKITSSLFVLFFIFKFTLQAQSSQKDKLIDAAKSLTLQQVVYDGKYVSIPYPMGDVPANTGVCTDVIIRAYRKIGIDLQKEVHLDMKKYFKLYPQKWGHRGPDTNIDHRRVPNLMTFFGRFGKTLPISDAATDYTPGNIVCWDLGSELTHIGIVIDQLSNDKQRPLIVHNIGAGQVIEDCLFKFKIIGHYSYAIEK
jgi:uncharacterized protein YijF (DUF1287 family)